MVAMSDFSTFSQITGMRSEYFWRIRSASALRFSKGCSSLNLDLMMKDLFAAVLDIVSVSLWLFEASRCEVGDGDVLCNAYEAGGGLKYFVSRRGELSVAAV